MKLRYNHYNEEFDVIDGKLDWGEVDEKYAISFVFKGDWRCHLEGPADEQLWPDGGKLTAGTDEEGDAILEGAFSGLTLDSQYVLHVQEDAELDTRIDQIL